MTKLEMINIGCGSIHHPAWINLDIASDDPTVLSADINSGLPFEDSSASACYSSHVLEHLDKKVAEDFLAECFRVLKSGGVIRLVVPDLEVIVREYLSVLNDVVNGDIAREQDYDWIMLELYDQVARNTPGGGMMEYLNNLPEGRRTYVKSRVGAEADHIWAGSATSKKYSITQRINALCKRQKRFRLKLASWFVRLIAGKSAATSFRHGLFRDGGEIHQWMYDRYSLGRLLAQAGFVDMKTCLSFESSIPDYTQYALDEVDGLIRKPDSLFIEAFKP